MLNVVKIRLVFCHFPKYVLVHTKIKSDVGTVNLFKPSSKIFWLTVPRPYFFCGSFVFFCVLCFSCFRVCLLLPCGGLIYWLLLVMFIVFLLLSHVVLWLRCRSWLYCFLIFAVFLTLMCHTNYLLAGKSHEGKEEGKDQESIQSSTTPDTGHHMGKWQSK